MKNKLKRLRLQKLKETRSESHQCTQDTVDFGFEMEPSECSSSGISSLSGTSSTPLKKSGVVGVKSAGCLEQVQRKRVKPKPSAAVKKPTNERQKEGGTHEGIPGKKRQKRKKAKISKGKSDENAEAVLSKRKAQPDEVESVPTKKVMGRICEISSTSTQFFNFAEWIDSHRDQLSSLSADLKFYFSKNCQSQATLERKLHLRAYIHDQIRTRFPNSLLIAVGSTVNGARWAIEVVCQFDSFQVNKTGSETSDLDLCLVVPCRSGRFPNDKSYGTEILRQVWIKKRNSSFLSWCPHVFRCEIHFGVVQSFSNLLNWFRPKSRSLG